MAKKQQQESPRRKRRGIDQRIAELEAKIASIKEREARKQAKADPTMRNVNSALKAIDKALDNAEDSGTKRVLNEARSILSGLLSGEVPSAPRAQRSAGEIADLSEALLSYVRSNPGQRGEQIAAAMATDAGEIRPVMKRLIADGKVKTEGQKRGMTYSPA